MNKFTKWSAEAFHVKNLQWKQVWKWQYIAIRQMPWTKRQNQFGHFFVLFEGVRWKAIKIQIAENDSLEFFKIAQDCNEELLGSLLIHILHFQIAFDWDWVEKDILFKSILTAALEMDSTLPQKWLY